jgi:DNA-binding beta-propeller fold protein YncE
MMNYVGLLAVLAVLLATASCAKSKAYIDYTMSGGIIWPGPPEKPRIKYLWNLQRISGGEGGGRLLRIIAGEPDDFDPDPKRSDRVVRPQGLFVDKEDVLYIADPGASRVTVTDLKDMSTFNIRSAGVVPLLSPIGVVADQEGTIYVTDAELKTVLVFNKKGKYMSHFEGEFERPTGIAINPSADTIYIADTWGHVVYVYGLDGKRRSKIGQRGENPGMLNYPTHVAVDRDGFLYVSDTLNFKVEIFTSSGTFLRSFGVIGDSYATFDKIKGIAVDSEKHIYVADSAQDMIKIFDEQGRLLLFFGKKGTFYGMFSLPTGIYIDENDRIFVADSKNRRIQAFKYLGTN